MSQDTMKSESKKKVLLTLYSPPQVSRSHDKGCLFELASSHPKAANTDYDIKYGFHVWHARQPHHLINTVNPPFPTPFFTDYESTIVRLEYNVGWEIYKIERFHTRQIRIEAQTVSMHTIPKTQGDFFFIHNALIASKLTQFIKARVLLARTQPASWYEGKFWIMELNIRQDLTFTIISLSCEN